MAGGGRWRQAGGAEHAEPGLPADAGPHAEILGLDVWEHAYCLVPEQAPGLCLAFWNVVNWDKVAELYTRLPASNLPCGSGSLLEFPAA